MFGGRIDRLQFLEHKNLAVDGPGMGQNEAIGSLSIDLKPISFPVDGINVRS